KRGQVVWGNPAIYKLTGYTPEEVRYLPLSTYHPSPEAHTAFSAFVGPRLDSGQIASTEIQLRRKDGTLRWVVMTGQAINPGRRFEDGILWIVQDITERKQAEVDLAI